MAESIKYVQPAIPKFDGHYDHWAKLMENFLRPKEYWHLVEHGIFIVPNKANASKAEIKLMEEQRLKDLKIKNYLYQAIDREILDTILNDETSKNIWDSMKQKLQGSTRVKRAQLQALRKDFEMLQMKEGESAEVKCFKCHKLGHFQYECPMWEKKANYAEMEDKEEQEDELLLMTFVDCKEGKKDEWFLDSGCSNHMSGNKEWFSELDENFRHKVKLGNDTRIAVMGKGQLQEKGLIITIQNNKCNVVHPKRGLTMEVNMSGNRMFVMTATMGAETTTCLQQDIVDWGENEEYDTEEQPEDEANNEEQQHGTETPCTGTNFRNESHIPALEIPVEGRARRHRREPVWMADYEEGEDLSDDDNAKAMLVTEDDPGVKAKT
ncbi:Zinc finger, CCHC-type [Sesbania bispinosa]|nr:Zinc finger, CCHC-type [Sesbania bispinosa]